MRGTLKIDEIDQFMMSPQFQELGNGLRATLVQHRKAYGQAVSASHAYPSIAPAIKAHLGVLYELVVQAKVALPSSASPEPVCICPVHGEVPA